MIKNISYTKPSHQEEIENCAIELLYAAKSLLIDLKYEHPDIFQEKSAGKLYNLCNSFTKKLIHGGI